MEILSYKRFLNNETGHHNPPFDQIEAKENITSICKINSLKDFFKGLM